MSTKLKRTFAKAGIPDTLPLTNDEILDQTKQMLEEIIFINPAIKYSAINAVHMLVQNNSSEVNIDDHIELVEKLIGFFFVDKNQHAFLDYSGLLSRDLYKVLNVLQMFLSLINDEHVTTLLYLNEIDQFRRDIHPQRAIWQHQSFTRMLADLKLWQEQSKSSCNAHTQK